MPRRIYLIGALKNGAIPDVARRLRSYGHDVFDAWWAPGPEADKFWQSYEESRGHSFGVALAQPFSQHIYAFDKFWLDWADTGVLVMPAGKSAHLELGYLLGRGLPGYILLPEEPADWDQMYNLATGVYYSVDELMEALD